jgi:hypothetical protein
VNAIVAPKHETTARRLVPAEDFRTILWWGGAPTAGRILEGGIMLEKELPSRRDRQYLHDSAVNLVNRAPDSHIRAASTLVRAE